MATEEIMISKLVKEGLACLEVKNWKDAINLLKEAETLEKWVEIYGP